jgi:hypothetical protein
MPHFKSAALSTVDPIAAVMKAEYVPPSVFQYLAEVLIESNP